MQDAVGTETPVSSLSGGNQQKVLFARSLLAEPTVLLADEPTRGVDAGARIELYQVLRDAAEAGKAVVVLSSDVVELQGLCDRVLVFSRGEIVRSLEGDEITEENITGAAITSDTQRAKGSPPARGARCACAGSRAGDYLPSVVLARADRSGSARYTTRRTAASCRSSTSSACCCWRPRSRSISLGQLIVLLTGAIDLSVGPLTGLVVVVFSFFAQPGPERRQARARHPRGDRRRARRRARQRDARARLPARVRARDAGDLHRDPGRLAAAALAAGRLHPSGRHEHAEDELGLGAASRSSRPAGSPSPPSSCCASVAPGLALRAVGSDETRAHRLGARVNVTHVSAYVLCSLFAAAGGMMLASQVGVGDPRIGVNYTLTSITAVVLGGASIFGGRGSFIGALLGARADPGDHHRRRPSCRSGSRGSTTCRGMLILVGAGVYSRARRTSPLAVSAEPA